jgi:hypothetical protein
MKRGGIHARHVFLVQRWIGVGDEMPARSAPSGASDHSFILLEALV